VDSFHNGNEMTTIVAPPLLEGFLSSMVVSPTLLQYQLSNNIIRKKRQWMMKQMLEGDGVILLLLTSLTYMKRSGGVFKSCSSFKHWTHICTEHHCQLPNECHRKEEQIKKMESEYRH